MFTKKRLLTAAAGALLSVLSVTPAVAQTDDFQLGGGGGDGRVVIGGGADDFATINPQIESMWLVDADSNTVIEEISDGEVFDRAMLPTNLTVMVEANADTESVMFGHGGIINLRTENHSPYAIGGDNNGDYAPFDLADGWHHVRARAFAADGATGSYGDEVLLSFAIFEHEIVVNSTIDAPDANPGDGVCSADLTGGNGGFTTRTEPRDEGRSGGTVLTNPTASASSRDVLVVADDNTRSGHQQEFVLAGPCTLRAAIEESNARSGRQRVEVPYLGSDYDLTLGVLTVTQPVAIEGIGDPTIDADLAFGVFHIDNADNVDLVGLRVLRGDVRGPGDGSGLPGGGILIEGSEVEIIDVEVREGVASNGGGVASYDSELDIVRSVVAGNRAGDEADGTPDGGMNQWGVGILLINSDTTIDSSSIHANEAGRGGGIAIQGGQLLMTNSAVIDNAASNQGGGLTVVGEETQVYIGWSTIARNANQTIQSGDAWEAQTTGGGIWMGGGDTFIGNSILAENTTVQPSHWDTYGPDCYVGPAATFTSYRGNVIGELTDACPLADPHVDGDLPWDLFGTNGDELDADLMSTNQFPVPYILPGLSSPAVDHGANNPAGFFGSCPSFDVRGQPRPADPALCDTGAAERQ